MGSGTASETEHEPVEREAPDQPTELPRRAWPGVLKRTLREFNADHLTDLTYLPLRDEPKT